MVEYLPPVVYHDETAPVRLRLLNPDAEAVEYTVRVSLAAPAGECPRGPASAIATLEAGGSRTIGFDLPSKGWTCADISIQAKGAASGALRIRRFDETDRIPRLEPRGERFYVVGDEAVPDPSAGAQAVPDPFAAAQAGGRQAGAVQTAVLALPQRTRQPDREWYLLRKLSRRLGEGSRPAGALVLGASLEESARTASEAQAVPGGRQAVPGPGGAEVRGVADAPEYLRLVRRNAGTRVDVVALPGEAHPTAIHPILGDLAAALEAFKRTRRAELVVWVADCSDARRATPVRTVRKCADFLLSRALATYDAARVVVIFVPEPSVPEKRRARYADELAAAARAYKATFVQLDSLANIEYWQPEGEPGAVAQRNVGEAMPTGRQALARYPNAGGRQAIAEAVLRAIRP